MSFLSRNENVSGQLSTDHRMSKEQCLLVTDVTDFRKLGFPNTNSRENELEETRKGFELEKVLK